MVKYKDINSDNFFDIQVFDAFIMNYLFIVNLFYVIGWLIIYVYFVKDVDEIFMWCIYIVFGVWEKVVENVCFVWKLDLEDYGGVFGVQF